MITNTNKRATEIQSSVDGAMGTVLLPMEKLCDNSEMHEEGFTCEHCKPRPATLEYLETLNLTENSMVFKTWWNLPEDVRDELSRGGDEDWAIFYHKNSVGAEVMYEQWESVRTQKECTEWDVGDCTIVIYNH